MIHLILLLISIFINGSKVSGEDSDIQVTFNTMTEPIVYRKWIRPSSNPTDFTIERNDEKKDPLYVNVSLDLYNYATVDEITSEYTFHLFLDFEWFDPRLEFSANKDVYDEDDIIEGGQYHIDRIWYPSVFVPNNQDPGSFDYDHQSANLLRIKTNGLVWMRKRKVLRIYCDMDFRQYPFDRQNCYVHFESSISTVNNLKLQWRTIQPFTQAESFRTIGFTLKEYKTLDSLKTYSKNNTFSRLTIMLILEREWAHYMFMVYIPTALIVITSWSTFWLEITSPPARVSIGVTTMLALVTTFKSTKSQLPSVSYWNALDIWNMVCIVFIFASLMEFACVNYIFNTEKRKRKNKKLKKRLPRKTSSETIPTISRMSSVSTLESIYTMSSIVEFNRRLSESYYDKRRRSSTPIDSGFTKQLDIKESTFDPSKRRRSSLALGFDFAKQMPNIKEEPLDPMMRRRSSTIKSRRQSVTQQKIEENTFKLTPQEFANDIDQKCRRIFPLCFMLFNLVYWSVLHIKF